MSRGVNTSDGPSECGVLPLLRLKVPFCIGSVAEGIADPLDSCVLKSSTAPNRTSALTSRLTHRWACYIRPPSPEDEVLLYSLIRYVTFRLDRSFPEPLRAVSEPPYFVDGFAWAEHVVHATISFAPESGLGDFELSHHVALRRRSDAAMCPTHLTATDVISSSSDPPRPPTLPDSGAAQLTFSERFDSLLVVHPRRRTLEFLSSLQQNGSRGGCAARAGRERQLAMDTMLRMSPRAASSDGIVTEEDVRIVMVRIMQERQEYHLTVRQEAHDNAVVSLHQGLLRLHEERFALLAELRRLEQLDTKWMSKCSSLLQRLEKRCKRMRGEEMESPPTVVLVEDDVSAA